NILVQPGPLSVHPIERSLSTPSFRIIDFGRVGSKEILQDGWESKCDQDLQEIRRDLWLVRVHSYGFHRAS
ncbi:hypothetical protein DFS33DRAFT_1260110, partial [Desarmillaria ectypa]